MAGAGGAPATAGASELLPTPGGNAASYVLALANDLKANLNAAQFVRKETRYQLVGGANKRQRERVDLDNLVEWQDDDKSMTSVTRPSLWRPGTSSTTSPNSRPMDTRWVT